MKSWSGFVAWVCVALAVNASGKDSSNRFEIKGQLVRSNPLYEWIIDDDSSETISPTVTVSKRTSNEHAESQWETLASGRFNEGEIDFNGQIDEFTEVRITVETKEDETLSIDAMLAPGGETVKFVFGDGKGVQPHQLSLVGTSKRSKFPERKFTVKGNLGSREGRLFGDAVIVLGYKYVDGEMLVETLGKAVLDNGRFLIEADTNEPRFVNITKRGVDPTPAVVEPTSEITISWREGTAQLLAKAKSGRHIELVESWQQSQEYLELMVAHNDAYARHIDDLRSDSPKSETNRESGGLEAKFGATDKQSDVANEDDSTVGEEDADKSAQLAELQKALLALVPKPAEGCEHVEVDPLSLISIRDLMRNRTGPQYFMLAQQMKGIRTRALQQVATTSEDPISVLLAMEMEAFDYFDENRSEALDIYDRLATILDEELVARRVTPRRERLAAHIAKEENDRKLAPGQHAPNATIPNLQGDEVGIYEVLAENEIVLIDFWASWCGPCIAAFPAMKSLYEEYKHSGFEILSISIDRTHQAWVDGSKEHALPWVNLGENEEWED